MTLIPAYDTKSLTFEGEVVVSAILSTVIQRHRGKYSSLAAGFLSPLASGENVRIKHSRYTKLDRRDI